MFQSSKTICLHQSLESVIPAPITILILSVESEDISNWKEELIQVNARWPLNCSLLRSINLWMWPTLVVLCRLNLPGLNPNCEVDSSFIYWTKHLFRLTGFLRSNFSNHPIKRSRI